MTRLLLLFLLLVVAMADNELEIHSELNDPALICKDCPPWMKPVPIINYPWEHEQNRINCSNCECGNSLSGVVKCNKTTKEVKLLACYCMSQSKVLNKTIVGNCLYSCSWKYMVDVSHLQLSELDNFTCRDQKRTGQLCGNCINDNHATCRCPEHDVCMNCDATNCTTESTVCMFTHEILCKHVQARVTMLSCELDT